MKSADRKTKAYKAAKLLASLLSLDYPNLQDKPLHKIIERLSPARHSLDFRSARINGTAYEFTASQAAIISVLWQAWENGTPKVGTACLLESANLDCDRISEVWKNHPAWGTLLKFSPGLFWLEI